MRTLAALAATAALVASSTACSGGGGDTTLTVFIASSLNTTFTSLESRFEHDHPGVDVVLSPGSSTTLATEITNGSPADVIATADATSMSIVRKAGDTASSPVRFATNRLVIAVPKGNPGHITGVASLRSASFVMCDPSAPCGAAAQAMLQKAGVSATPKSLEVDVASTLAKVETGEVDAGIVYVSDARTARSEVDAIAIPAAVNVTNPYFIAPVAGASHLALARQWIDLVRSAAGQRVLRRAGFGPP